MRSKTLRFDQLLAEVAALQAAVLADRAACAPSSLEGARVPLPWLSLLWKTHRAMGQDTRHFLAPFKSWPFTKASRKPAEQRPRRATARESKAVPSRRARVPTAGRGRWRFCSLSRSTRQRIPDSGLARLPATARVAAGNARWRLCAPQPWGPRLPRLGGCFSMRFA